MKHKQNVYAPIFNRKMVMGVLVILMIVFNANWLLANGNEQLGITLPVFSGKYDVGVTSLGSFGLRGEATALMKIPEDAVIVAAYVYLSGYSNLTAGQLTSFPVEISDDEGNSATVTAELIGISTEADYVCFTYRGDVSKYIVNGEQTYHVTAKTLPATPTRGRLYGGGLLVVYELPNLPQADIWIADGLDYINANKNIPHTKTVAFPFSGNRFERYGAVKIFAGVDDRNSASAIWYKLGHGDLPTDIIDTPNAMDYLNSSSADPAVDTNPLSDGIGIRRHWSMVEYLIQVQSEQGWAAVQLESQTDNPNLSPLSGVWNMVAFKLPLEETGCGSIGDRVFHDKNSNGIRDAMEAGIPSVKVVLYQDNGDGVFSPETDSFIDSTRTNRLGFYLFQNLQFGDYFVDIEHPYLDSSFVTLTTQNDPTGLISLSSCDAVLDVDFGVLIDMSQFSFEPSRVDSFSGYFRNFQGVFLNWSVQAGTENIGFDVYRSESINGSYEILNSEVIPPSTSSDAVHRYTYQDETVEDGQTYYYQVADVYVDGTTTMHGPISVTAQSTGVDRNAIDQVQSDGYKLGSAYPNPFNGKTTIHYKMKESGMVKIEIYNVLGRKVRTLVAAVREAGVHVVTWNGNDDMNQSVGSGIYVCKMVTNNFIESRSMLYLK